MGYVWVVHRVATAEEVTFSEIIPPWIWPLVGLYFVIGAGLSIIVYRDARRLRVPPWKSVVNMVVFWPIAIWIHFFLFRRDADRWRAAVMNTNNNSSSSSD